MKDKNKMQIFFILTVKAVYAGDLQLVFELCQLLEFIDINSWHSSKTSWK